MALDEYKEILKLDDSELEDLIKKWIADELSLYVDFVRRSGTGDRGLDAVGFATRARFDGAWDNYQCKQLLRPLDQGQLLGELGKVLYYSSRGEFILPRRYIFVAPNGITKPANILLDRPSNLRDAVVDHWDKNCGSKIISKKNVPMDDALSEALDNYDFNTVEGWDVHKIVELPRMRKNLHLHLDIDPGSAPKGKVPAEIKSSEEPYINQLKQIYENQIGTEFSDVNEVFKHVKFGPHLKDQRRRFHDAEAFQRYFRDSIPIGILEQFEIDIYDGVVDEFRSTTGYDRVNKVMTRAGSLSVSGVFERHRRAPPSVKQGTCHQMANIRKLPWNQ